MNKIFALLAAISMLCSCGSNPKTDPNVTDTLTTHDPGTYTEDWGEADGRKVQLFTLTNKNGVQVSISNYGGTITKWLVPGKDGKQVNIVLGFDSLAGYLNKPPYFGATIGRYGNRIANAKFKIDNATYTLAANNGKNNLHGGNKGFDKVVWDVVQTGDSIPQLTLSYLSKDGEEGFPGNLKATVKFT
ncbi:MAG TPA: galactose-1-epimerase, partial [Chitinophagaceae bacterium]|nr:galactose-1-epimerase [Chitinophagaceae bacterium]